ncbi:peptide-methionine (S)-S-oxide reductase MsrA [Marinobacter sp.]|uniref:peptide-methionine (S)-S-oxide reductase MsrA n=1 Tax=Marinobacter sp. TaxID=50741 RepID=UPI00384C4811
MMKQVGIAALILMAGLIGVQLSATADSGNSKHAPDDPSLAVATFAGGCFWCVEAAFEEKVPGIEEAVSGYAGGEEKNPTYDQVSAGRTGHTEAVQVYYDPEKITYEGLLQALWRMMNPTDAKGQFVDRGSQYRPAIFYHNDKQRQIAEASKKALEESGRYDNPVVIEIVPFESFYAAEDYHQDYYKKSPVRYNVYTFNSGRYQFIDRVWGEDQKVDYSKYDPEGRDPAASMDGSPAEETVSSADAASADAEWADRGMPGTGFDPVSFEKPSEEELRKHLTPLQYEVTQEDGTERAYDNPYWDEKRPGLYVDIVSGEPLYSSSDKYKSNTGWPSFIRAIGEDVVVTREDRSWFGVRTELRSAVADSHLGHLFEDGPPPTGLRHCINSAALTFIPKEDLEQAGYGEYVDQVGDPIS